MSRTSPAVDSTSSSDRSKQGQPSQLGSAAVESSLAMAEPGYFLCLSIDDQSINPARMNSLGLCVGRPIELVSTGDPMIIRVAGTAVGLSRQLADAVTVAELPTTDTV